MKLVGKGWFSRLLAVLLIMTFLMPSGPVSAFAEAGDAGAEDAGDLIQNQTETNTTETNTPVSDEEESGSGDQYFYSEGI